MQASVVWEKNQSHFQYIKHSMLHNMAISFLSRPLLLWPSLFAFEFPLLHSFSRGSASLFRIVLFHPGVDLLVHALVASRPLRPFLGRGLFGHHVFDFRLLAHRLRFLVHTLDLFGLFSCAQVLIFQNGGRLLFGLLHFLGNLPLLPGLGLNYLLDGFDANVVLFVFVVFHCLGVDLGHFPHVVLLLLHKPVGKILVRIIEHVPVPGCLFQFSATLLTADKLLAQCQFFWRQNGTFLGFLDWHNFKTILLSATSFRFRFLISVWIMFVFVKV